MAHPRTHTARAVEGRTVDLALLAILLLALAFRLYRIDAPFIDAHSWRQVTNADIARHYATGSLNLFAPRVSWGGADGIVGLEFPLLQWLTGAAWRVTGERAAVARLVATLFSVAGVWLMFLLGGRLFGRAAGLAAAFLLAVSPGAIFFGRSLLSDTPMLTFAIGALYAWDRYFAERRTGWLTTAVIATALTGLVKLPAILILAGVAGLAWSHARWEALRDRAVLTGAAIAIVLVASWYAYADLIFQRTGLTQAVFRPSGTYPADVAPGVVFTPVLHWSTPWRLVTWDYWWVLADRLWGLYLTPYGSLAALVGCWLAARHRRALAVHLWAIAALALVIATPEGQYWHEFHTLPLVPPLLLYAAVAAAPIFDLRWAGEGRALGRRTAGAVLAVALVIVSIQTFRGSGALTHLYRADTTGGMFLATGQLVRSLTTDELMVTVDYEEVGTNSPMMLYFAHRRGWSFDIDSISADLIEHLRTTKGARYFVTTTWRALQSRKPEVAAYLARFRAVAPPEGLPPDVHIVELR